MSAIILLILLLLAAVSFFFSSAETSVIGLSKIRLRHMLKKGVKGAQSVQRVMTRLDKVLAAILIGNNLVNIAISSIATGIFVQIYGYHWGVIVSTFTTTLVLLIFCEVTPKILSAKHSDKVALVAAPIMEVVVAVFNPLIVLFIGMSNLILRIFGIKLSKRSPLITEEELRTMIEIGKEEGVLSEEERRMLHRIFEFGDTRLNDVMVPKDEIVAVDINSGSEALMNIFVEKGHARLPVYSGSPDNIVGIVYAHDLLYILREKGLFLLPDLLRDACYVPETMRVNELLKRFQSEKIQIAIVLDKNKKTSGLVTLEDLLEEIVGEIEEKQPRRRRGAR
ncbi:MAG: hemolysin family protein [Candidatus Omnitrophica bacterium]|nr:hemolysin family protein [Candidatus Omnitrophota bacterium]MDD5042095.1 hemolysin family protein [Candidatus Omnitrophota bacterium]MDD5500287.1 hemolysin family protein [Candidatus Omnitrophota bacterium]